MDRSQRRPPIPFRRVAVALPAALALAMVAAEALAQARPLPSGPAGPSPSLERHRDGSSVIDSPLRGGNVFNNFPAFTVDRKGEKVKPPKPEEAAGDAFSLGEAADAPLPPRSASVTERILREIEVRKSIAKRREALARSRAKIASGDTETDPPAEPLAFAQIAGFGEEPEPLMPATEPTARGEEERADAPTRPRSSAWRGRQAPDAPEAPVERGLTGRSAIDASRRPMSGGVRAGAPAARAGWGQAAPRDAAAQAAPRPLNAGRPIASPADQRPGGAEAGAAAGPRPTGRASDRPARRPPLFPDRAAP